MKRFVLFAIILLPFLSIKSQEAILISELYPELRYHELKGEVSFAEYKQVKGSPFLFEDWMQGDIFLDNGKEINNVMIRLDVFAHRILVYHENLKRVVLIEKQHANEFILQVGSEEKRYRKLFNVNSKAKVLDGCYFEVLSEGEISLFKLNFLDLYTINDPGSIFIEEFYEQKNYIVFVNNEYRQIRLRKNYFYHNYPQYKDQLRKYIRKNKLKVGTEKDFVKAVNYLNEILELLKNE